MNPLRLVTPAASATGGGMITAAGVIPAEVLMGRAGRVAAELLAVGRTGERAIVSFGNTPDFYAGLVGCWMAGMTPVLLDPMVKTELAEAAKITKAQVVLGRDRAGVTLPDHVAVVAPDDGMAEPLEPPELCESDPILFLFTSGSSGKPTLVPKTYKQIAVEVDFIAALFDHPLRVATLVPWCHIWGLLSAFFVPLATGGVCDITAGVSALTVLERASRGALDLVTAVPAYYQAMVRLLQAGKVGRLPGSVCFGSSSAPLSGLLRNEFTALTSCRITDIYGSTEAGGMAYRHADGPWTTEPHVEIRVDGDGMLEVRSASVSFETPDGFFKTGDMVQIEGNGFTLLGRGDDVVKIGGRRIALGEVQRVIEACPEVLRAAVMAEEVRGALRLTAYVEPAGAPLNPESIKRFVRERLADHKVPRVVHILERLPLTSSGKVDRQQLRAMPGTGK